MILLIIPDSKKFQDCCGHLLSKSWQRQQLLQGRGRYFGRTNFARKSVICPHMLLRPLLNHFLLLVNLVNTKLSKKSKKMTETLVCRYSSDSTQRELSNEYQHDRVQMVFKTFCIFLPWTKVASAWKGLI